MYRKLILPLFFMVCLSGVANAQPEKEALEKLEEATKLIQEATELLESPKVMAGNPFANVWSRKKERSFLKRFCEILDCPDCKLSKAEKHRVKMAVIFSKKARDEAKEFMADAYATADIRVRLATTGETRGPPVEFGDIDWENFDWEKAKEFWVEIIKTIVEVIKLFVVQERAKVERLASAKNWIRQTGFFMCC